MAGLVHLVPVTQEDVHIRTLFGTALLKLELYRTVMSWQAGSSFLLMFLQGALQDSTATLPLERTLQHSKEGMLQEAGTPIHNPGSHTGSYGLPRQPSQWALAQL